MRKWGPKLSPHSLPCRADPDLAPKVLEEVPIDIQSGGPPPIHACTCMQNFAVKEKLQDMAALKQVKADAKAEEKAEKEMAKTRVEVAKEVRKAKEAQAARDLHIGKAEQKVDDQVSKNCSKEEQCDRDDDCSNEAQPPFAGVDSSSRTPGPAPTRYL
ncbi:hypothetical protein Syun_018330 [Stephania yunnanensis]|uniref:Uncharacterized protein n=1 Tax=Stephania yunnanensis TaxID=152371 RepID=A0AAP0NVQ0_9MAGN